uniref:Uncharacterized protein n=1 Tax=Lates calcarifer TaxID=8187 RepID=A0A4W6C788_LATCA
MRMLNSINDLKRINFGQSVPKHSLLLLHWFANEVDIDRNNVIRLTFNPNGDYGSHHYRNVERLLDPLPHGYQYYTIGNLNQWTSVRLPNYVTRPRTEHDGGNRDRIILRVREQNTDQQILQSIDQVFITQHYGNLGTAYDRTHTYEITTNLLREIREFSVGQNQLSLRYLREHFGKVKLSILGQSQNQNTTSSVNLIMLPPITTLIQLGLFVYKKIVKLGVKSSNYPFISLLIYWLIMFSINQSIT